ncbi:MspA protein [Nocardia pseudobrasiliensis]|uniref:MspA protein n=1 Tax=Nocardia pseudobrasiliensis TaxID=45979 RepID=A0A370I9H9_9NOCA|nr:MspA protein [Nocardia pseudobrasiliensis]
MRGVTTVLVAAALAVAAPDSGSAHATEIRIDQHESVRTPDGFALTVSSADTRVRAVPALDGNPLSREAFVDGIGIGSVDGPIGARVRGAILDVGLEFARPATLWGVQLIGNAPAANITIGPTVAVDPTGAVAPGGSVGSGGTAWPEEDAKVVIDPGGVVDRSLAKFAMTSSAAYADLSGTRVAVTAALGPVSVRMYVRMVLFTDNGPTSAVVYGAPVTL